MSNYTNTIIICHKLLSNLILFFIPLPNFFLALYIRSNERTGFLPNYFSFLINLL